MTTGTNKWVTGTIWYGIELNFWALPGCDIYLSRNGFIFWTDTASGLIMRSNFDGSSVLTVLRGLIRPG